jgi:hypothetical protein
LVIVLFVTLGVPASAETIPIPVIGAGLWRR